jgi:hypothetical protein
LAIIVCGSILLVFSGTVKLSDLPEFREVLASHHVFASSSLDILTPFIAILEVLAGIVCIWMLAVHGRPLLAGLVLASTFLLFTAYAAWLVFHPPPAPTSCGCVGAGSVVEPHEWLWVAWRNVGLIVVALGAGRVADRASFRIPA